MSGCRRRQRAGLGKLQAAGAGVQDPLPTSSVRPRPPCDQGSPRDWGWLPLGGQGRGPGSGGQDSQCGKQSHGDFSRLGPGRDLSSGQGGWARLGWAGLREGLAGHTPTATCLEGDWRWSGSTAAGSWEA